MRAKLFIIECRTPEGHMHTHLTCSPTDAKAEARDLSLLHKEATVTLTKWLFTGKPEDVLVAVAENVQMVQDLDVVTAHYKQKKETTSQIALTQTYVRGRLKASSEPAEPAGLDT